MFGAQLGDYLSQFYSNGPYIHNVDNPLPYQSAFFSSYTVETNKHIEALTRMIGIMENTEKIFYDDMGVANIKEFNEQYMMGKNVLTKGRIKRASSFQGTFWARIDFLIVVQLKEILTLEFRQKDYSSIIRDTFSARPGIWDSMKNALVELYSAEIGTKKFTDRAALILLNHLNIEEKRQLIGRGDINLSQGELWELSQGLIRKVKLLGEKGDFAKVAPSVQDEINKLYFRQELDKQISKKTKEAISTIKRELRLIFEEEYTKKGKKLPEKKLANFQQTLINEVKKWSEEPASRSIFRVESQFSGELGEQSLKILWKLNFDNKIRGLRQTGAEKGEQVIKSYNIKTGEITNILKRKKSKDDEDEELTHVGSITPDIVFTAKKSKKTYAFSVKNYLGSMLVDGLEDLQIHIRGKKKLHTFLGEAAAAGSNFEGIGIGVDEIQRFVYVFINNMFRDEDSSMLLIKFMSSLINFYLQNQFIKSLSHMNNEIGDVRNSFIVLAGMYLIPMSSILRSVRDTLQQIADKNYGDSAGGLIAPGQLDLNDTATGNLMGIYRELVYEKRGIRDATPEWQPGDPYGSAMLSAGIGAGTQAYESMNMPEITFNVEKLIAAVESAMSIAK